MKRYSNESLFEKLSGHFYDGSSISTVSSQNRIAKSISDHLTRLLNTRRGTIPHIPDYGLSDISDIYNRLPNSKLELKDEILNAIQKFEPRLKRVRIEILDFEPADFRIKLKIVATIRNGERIVLQSNVRSNGAIDLNSFTGR